MRRRMSFTLAAVALIAVAALLLVLAPAVPRRRLVGVQEVPAPASQAATTPPSPATPGTRAAPPTPAAPATPGIPGVTDLGPRDPGQVQAMAPAPGWPDQPVILAARRQDLVRTVDGGATWASFPIVWEPQPINPTLAPALRTLMLAPTAPGALPPAFAVVQRFATSTTQTVPGSTSGRHSQRSAPGQYWAR